MNIRKSLQWTIGLSSVAMLASFSSVIQAIPAPTSTSTEITPVTEVSATANPIATEVVISTAPPVAAPTAAPIVRPAATVAPKPVVKKSVTVTTAPVTTAKPATAVATPAPTVATPTPAPVQQVVVQPKRMRSTAS